MPVRGAQKLSSWRFKGPVLLKHAADRFELLCGLVRFAFTCVGDDDEVRASYLDRFPWTRKAYVLCGQEKKSK